MQKRIRLSAQWAMERLEAATSWFIEGQAAARSEASARVARNLVVVLLLGFLNLLWSAVYQYPTNRPIALMALAAIPAPMVLAIALRLGAPLQVLTNAAVFGIYAITGGIALSTSGQWAGGLFGLTLVPAVAILLGNRRSGLAWTAVTVLSIVGLGWLGSQGPESALFAVSSVESQKAIFRAAGILTLAIVAVAYSYSAQFERANEALTVTVDRLTESEHRFRAITENAYDVIAELDLDGRFRFASPGIEESLGWKTDELMGRVVHSLIHADDLPRAREYWARLLEKGAVREATLRFQHRSEGDRWLEVSMRSYRSSGGEARVVAVARDVTGRLEREKLIRHQQNFVEIGTMASGAAHQLSVPMEAILASAQAADERREEADYGTAAIEALETIEEQATRGNRILRALLSFSRREVSERWPEKLDAIVRRAVRAVEIEEADATKQIVLSLGHRNSTALVSPIEIERVLINLIRNAFQADARLVVVGVDVPNRTHVEITVSDDGHGIHRDFRESVFDSFFTTCPESKSGLGLTIAREIIEDHEGELHLVDSSPDGSVFKIRLPRAFVQSV